MRGKKWKVGRRQCNVVFILSSVPCMTFNHLTMQDKVGNYSTRLFSPTGVRFQQVDVRYIAQSLISRKHEG